jgi:hypothetical protein
LTVTYSYSTNDTFTIAHARKLAGKVSADMDQCRLFYGEPSTSNIEAYRDELIVMLAGRFVDRYEFGYKTADDRRVVSWRYRVTSSGDLEGGRSGGLHASADIANAVMFNYLWTNTAWWELTEAARDRVRADHEVRRSAGDPPSDGSGHWVQDRSYGAGGVVLQREEFRPW